MKVFAISAALLLSLSAQAQKIVEITAADTQRAEKILSGMTLAQKCKLISGVPAKGRNEEEQLAGNVRDQNTLGGCPEVGVQEVYMADGPQGINNKLKNDDACTYYACGLSAAASFDREAVLAMGDGLGMDARARGVGILLGPGANIYRTALCGRNFEYFGEDPYLAGEVACSYVKGVQAHGVVATMKHFAANNQEWDRFIISANIDDRTLHEIYLEPFRKAVQEAGLGAVMTACGRINDVPGSQNGYLLEQTLRRDWGFKGMTMCDWQTTYSTLLSIRNGIDIEMPNPFARNYERVRTLVENGVLLESEVDRHCLRILQTLSAFGLIDRELVDRSIEKDNPYCHAKAYEAAIGGPVLVKNNGILPLKQKKTAVLMTGPYCDELVAGGGSGWVHPFDGAYVTTFSGLTKAGFKVSKASEPGDEELRKAGAVIVEVGFGSKLESEQHDHSFSLPMDQEEILRQATSVSDKVIVIVHSGCEVDMRAWGDKAAAIIYAWYGGEHTGTVLADLLSGKVSFSGHLPFTMWGTFENNPASDTYFADKYISYHGRTRFGENPHVDYKEGVFLGYRGIEKFGRKPLYPFGWGLSYSTFEYSNFSVTPSGDGYDVSFSVKNTGKCAAAAAPQIYVSPVNPSLPRPVRELKQFTKVKLSKGETRTVTLHLGARAFMHFDTPSHSWLADRGEYRIQLGTDSQTIIAGQPIVLK